MEAKDYRIRRSNAEKIQSKPTYDISDEFYGQVPSPPKSMRPLLAEELQRRSSSNASCRLSTRTESTTLSSRSTSPSGVCLSRPRSPVDEGIVHNPHRFLIQKMRPASPSPKMMRDFNHEACSHSATPRATSPTDFHMLDDPRQFLREKIRSSSLSELAQLRKLDIHSVYNHDIDVVNDGDGK